MNGPMISVVTFMFHRTKYNWYSKYGWDYLPFQWKVLDVANTIEFNKVNLKYNFEEIATKVIYKLIEINNKLEKYQQHFTYSLWDEIVLYVIYATVNVLFPFNEDMNYSIVQKILTKIGGSGNDVLDISVGLFNNLNSTKQKNDGYIEAKQIRTIENQCENSELILSSEKIMYMIRRFLRDDSQPFGNNSE